MTGKENIGEKKRKEKSKQESGRIRDPSNPSVRISGLDETTFQLEKLTETWQAGNGRKRDKMIAKPRYARKIHIREEWERIRIHAYRKKGAKLS
jgi:hypothetical protein